MKHWLLIGAVAAAVVAYLWWKRNQEVPSA